MGAGLRGILRGADAPPGTDHRRPPPRTAAHGLDLLQRNGRGRVAILVFEYDVLPARRIQTTRTSAWASRPGRRRSTTDIAATSTCSAAPSRRSPADDPEVPALAASWCASWNDIDRHFGFEEAQLFPRVADADDGDLAALLAEEHASIRVYVAAELLPLARAAPTGFADRRRRHATATGAGGSSSARSRTSRRRRWRCCPLLDDLLDDDTDRELAFDFIDRLSSCHRLKGRHDADTAPPRPRSGRSPHRPLSAVVAIDAAGGRRLPPPGHPSAGCARRSAVPLRAVYSDPVRASSARHARACWPASSARHQRTLRLRNDGRAASARPGHRRAVLAAWGCATAARRSRTTTELAGRRLAWPGFVAGPELAPGSSCTAASWRPPSATTPSCQIEPRAGSTTAGRGNDHARTAWRATAPTMRSMTPADLDAIVRIDRTITGRDRL